MRKGLAIVWMFAALLLAASSARGQTAVPAFDADVVGVRSDAEEGKTRIDVYTKIPLSNLQFIKAANGFRADYHITADFYELGPNDTKGTRVQSHVWERPVFVDRFEATQSDQHFDAVTQSLAFRPGRYLMEIQVEDEANGRTALEEVPFVVRNLGKSVAVSDLIVIDEYDGDENTISPNVSNRVSTEADGLRFFYEVYANRPTPVQITRELIRMKKAPEKPSIRSIFRGDDEETKLGEVTYMKPSSTVLKKGRHAFVADIPLADIAAGDYLVRVTLEDEEGRRLDQTQKVISAHWTGLDEHIRNLDQAIAQLAYIAKDKEVRHIREAPTAAERLARFRNFWKRRDPTPSTERNENMEEYYYRVSFANRKYGTLEEGWKTDRGNVIVRFGEPDFIERRPFNFDVEPYEVWYYYRLGRRFIFIDRTGLGDYELWVPIWDERNRIR